MRPSLSLTLAVLLGCVPLPHPMEPPGPPAPAERVSADPAAEVIRAAAQGDAARLRGLLARGGPVDARYKYGSALVAAILGDHAAAAEVLLKAGARGLNEPQGELNRRPLSIAALGGSPALVGLLLRHGADVGAFDPDGSDALGLAVAEGSAEVVRVLLDAGADPNRRSAEGLAAVARAALHGRPEPLRALLDRGGALELRDPAGVTPHLFAAAQGREAAVELLLERGARVNAFDGDGHQPLGAALRLKDVAVRERLAARLRAGGARERAALRPVDAEFLAAA